MTPPCGVPARVRCSAERRPSKDYQRNSAWLQLVTLVVSLLGWLRLIALDGELANAEPKMLPFQIVSAPARLVVHARNRIPKTHPAELGQTPLTTAWTRIHALHPA